MFQRATKTKSRLRMALIGPAGSGKTYSALSIARGLGTIAVIDTEHGSASKYADLFQFDALELDTFHPQRYIDAVHAAEQAHYGVLIIDGLSHAWAGKGGLLEQVDALKKRGGNQFAVWGDVTPIQNLLIETILGSRLHIIATLRAKTEYALDERGRPRKVGMGAIQRDGVEYEFDVVGELSHDNVMTITKTRIPALNNAVIPRPGLEIAAQIQKWLDTGETSRQDLIQTLGTLRQQARAAGLNPPSLDPTVVNIEVLQQAISEQQRQLNEVAP